MLLDHISAELFQDWADFYSVEPWGFEIDEARFARLCTTILASQGAKVDPALFLHRQPEAPAEEDLMEKMKRMFGGKR